jgi:hypothetical protein
MVTLNTKENIPEYFYVFVDMDNMLTNNNLCITKGFSSSAISIPDPKIINDYLNGTLDYLPFVPNPNIARKPMSMFQNTITSEYRTEYNCEICRKQYFPFYPSRLSAIYAFGDYETCEKAAEMYHGKINNWNLDNVKKFKLEDNSFTRIVKVNMELISWERTANKISSLNQSTETQIWQAYWNGEGNGIFELPTINGRQRFEVDTIWEYLIEGRITLVE